MYDSLKQLILDNIPLKEEELRIVLSFFSPISVAKGETLVSAGTICQNLYFIERGVLRMYYKKGESQITRYMASEGEFATALSSFLTQRPTKENMEAIEPSTLWVLSYTDLHTLYAQIPVWNIFSRRLLEEAYLENTLRMEGLITQTAEERYLTFIESNPELAMRVPQQYIATYLGITPISLSRIRAKIARSKS